MRLSLALVALLGCTPDMTKAGPDGGTAPPPTGPVQLVEDGRYDLVFVGFTPYNACDSLELSGYDLAFAGDDPACVERVGRWSDSCQCYDGGAAFRDWCLCPGIERLTAAFIDAERFQVTGVLEAYPRR